MDNNISLESTSVVHHHSTEQRCTSCTDDSMKLVADSGLQSEFTLHDTGSLSIINDRSIIDEVSSSSLPPPTISSPENGHMGDSSSGTTEVLRTEDMQQFEGESDEDYLVRTCK